MAERSDHQQAERNGRVTSTKSRSHSPNRRWAGARRAQTIVFGGLLLLAIAAGLAFWQKPQVVRLAKHFAADRQLAKAEAALQAGEGTEALDKALRSWELEPGGIDTLRVLLAAGRDRRDSRLLVMAREMITHPDATLDDQVDALATLNDLGATAEFATLYRLLPSPRLDDAAVRLQWLRWAVMLNQPREVLAKLDEWGATDSEWTDPEQAASAGILRWSLLMQRGDRDGDTEAGELALRLLETHGSTAATAPRVEPLLAAMRRLPPERFPSELAGRLRTVLASPAFDASAVLRGDPMLLLTLEIAADPDRRIEVIDAAVAQHRERHVEALCLWLQRLSDNARSLSLVDLTSWNAGAWSPALFSCQVRALIAEERFEEAMTLLNDPIDGVDVVDASIARAWVAGRLDLPIEVAGSWQKAMAAAQADATRNHYLKIAGAARQAGELAVAVDALLGAVDNRLGRFPAATETAWAIDYLMEQDRPQDLLRLTQRLVVNEGHPAMVNNALYLALICSEDGAVEDQWIEVAEQLAEQVSEYPEIRNTLALFYCLAGRHEEAVAAFRPEELEPSGWATMRDTGRATLALVLSGNDRRDPFESVVESVDWAAMTTLESEFYRRHLEGHARARIEAAQRRREQQKADGSGTGGSFLETNDRLPLLLPE